MSIETFRERVNLKIFDSKETALLIFRILSSLVAVLGVGLLIYSLGFPQNDESRKGAREARFGVVVQKREK